MPCVKCKVGSFQCAGSVFSVQCTVNNLKCAVQSSSLQCAVCNVNYVQCEFCSVQCNSLGAKRPQKG